VSRSSSDRQPPRHRRFDPDDRDDEHRALTVAAEANGANDITEGQTMSEPVNYDDLDPGIRWLVKLFNEHGIETCDSGDGVSKEKAARSLDIPHVFARAKAMGVAGLMEGHRIAETMLMLVPENEQVEGMSGWSVQLMYDPATDDTIVAAYGPGPLPDGCRPVDP
jgi:hypothetical protein